MHLIWCRDISCSVTALVISGKTFQKTLRKRLQKRYCPDLMTVSLIISGVLLNKNL